MKTSQENDAPVVERSAGVEESTPSDPEEIREQIEVTRAELGETVEALAAKADVKAQVKDKVEGYKGELKQQQEQLTAKVAEVRGKVSEATPEQARDVAASLQQRIKEQPMPAVFLAGLLVGWLIGKRR